MSASLRAQTNNPALSSDTNSPSVAAETVGEPTNVPGPLVTNTVVAPKTDTPALTATNLAALNASNLLARAATNTAIVIPTSVEGRPVPAYTNFTVIEERNIFNPNRRKGGSNRIFTNAPQPQIDSFWLTGILASDKGVFSFFNGSSSSYMKALKTGGVIGGCKVTAIEPPDAVQLEVAGKPVELPIGMQMRRRDGGPWEKTEMSPDSTSYSGGSEPSLRPAGESPRFNRRQRGGDSPFGFSAPDDSNTTIFRGSSPPSGSSGSGGGGDALERLLKRRQQELDGQKPK